jgi:hypothetical protein
MDSCVAIWDVFATMRTIRLFKTLANFILVEFNELALLMAPTIVHCAQFAGEHHIQVLNLRFALKF